MASTILQHSIPVSNHQGLDEAPHRSRSIKSINWKEWLLWLGISFLLMLFLTRSSFLYPYNNWDDSNSYFSMGKSMFHGTLIYRDLFDQKGPYLYFLYGLCSLISRTTFKGVFLMEIIWGMFDLLLLRRIMNLFCSRRVSVVLTPILFACMCASKSFYWGGSAEEICLPFLLLTLYLLLRSLTDPVHPVNPSAASSGRVRQASELSSSTDDKTSAHHPFRQTDGFFSPCSVFLAGLCCGFVFCVKFTMMGFFLGFAIIVILSCRSFREFLRLAGWFLLGVIIPFVPWVIYFAIRGGLDDWYRVYIYTNVFRYSSFGANSHGESLTARVYDLAKILYWLILDNFQYFLFIIVGIFWFLFRPVKILLRVAPLLLFALTFLFIFIGGIHLPYYSFPLTVFAVTGMAAVGCLADRILRRFPLQAGQTGVSRPETGKYQSIVTAAGLTVSLILSFAVYWSCSWNRYYLFYTRDDVFLSLFTDDINRDRAAGIVDPDNTTLLNDGCLDCGLYTTADIYPTCYWFQTQTLPGNEVDNAQTRYIADGVTDYVVVRGSISPALPAHYEQIDSFHQVMGDSEYDYYLFRKK